MLRFSRWIYGAASPRDLSLRRMSPRVLTGGGGFLYSLSPDGGAPTELRTERILQIEKTGDLSEISPTISASLSRSSSGWCSYKVNFI